MESFYLVTKDPDPLVRHLQTPTAVLAMLPNVKPRKALRLLEEIDYGLAHQRSPRAAGGKGRSRERCQVKVLAGEYVGSRDTGVVVTLDHIEGIFSEDINPVTGWFQKKVTMNGARTILRLYEEGAFELRRKRDAIEDALLLKEYIASEADLLEHVRLAEQERQARAKQNAHFIAKPDEVPECEFSLSLFNAIFREHKGPGEGSLTIGGLEVSKHLTRYTSNSGKNSDWAISYSWTGPDGQTHTIDRESQYAGNRRNDPNRNWGLGRD